MKIFKDRTDAGQQLGKALEKYRRKGALVLAIPRGGVPVAFEVARALNAPLDVIVSRKLPIPWNTEAGFGALAPDGTAYIDQESASQLGLGQGSIEKIKKEIWSEIKRRQKVFRGKKRFPNLKNKVVILIDDGLATGSTMKASIEFVKKKKPQKIICALPVCSYGSYKEVKKMADEIICLDIKKSYPFAVADSYENWYDLDDKEVLEYLKKIF